MSRYACRDCGTPSPTPRCAACRPPAAKRSRARHTGARPYRRARAGCLANDDTCWLCGLPGADTVDHVHPVALGGTNDPANLRPAHAPCNRAKGARLRLD